MGQQRRSILSIYPFELFFFRLGDACLMMSCHVAFEMLESSLSLYFVVKYTLVNVMIVESSLGRGSNSIPALLFADCVVSLCFYLIILIIPLLLVKSQFWFDTPVYRNPTQDIQEVVMCGGSDV